jgi:hypothetical protein
MKDDWEDSGKHFQGRLTRRVVCVYIPCLVWYWIIGLRGLVDFMGLYPIENTGL